MTIEIVDICNEIQIYKYFGNRSFAGGFFLLDWNAGLKGSW